MRFIAALSLVAVLATSGVAQFTATVTTVGQGCQIMPGYAATLSVTQPVIGQQVTILPAGLPAGDGTLWMSLGPPASPTALFPGCFAYVDLNTFVPLTQFITGTAGIGWIVMTVPNDPTIVGVHLTLQATITATWQPAGQVPLVTEAAWVVIGDQF